MIADAGACGGDCDGDDSSSFITIICRMTQKSQRRRPTFRTTNVGDSLVSIALLMVYRWGVFNYFHHIMSNSLLYGCWCLHFPSSASSSSSHRSREEKLWFLVSSNVEKSTDSNVNPTIQRTMMTWHGLEMWREMDEMWREREDKGRTDKFCSF